MIIRDINIHSLNNQLIYSWDMGRHQNAEIFDIVKGQKAVTQNGIWEIDKHTHWKKISEIKIKGENPQTAFDENDGRVFIVKDNFIYEYNIAENRMHTLHFQHGNPHSSLTNNLIYNPIQNNLISYHVGRKEFSIFDFNSNLWSQNPQTYLINAMQHNSLIASDHNELITFGGYGEHRYNAVLTKYNLSDESLVSKDLSNDIEPRYLSSATYCGNGNLYILGGYGCKSGIQDGFTRNYYDLHLINTDSMSCRKIWQFDENDLFVTFSQSMVIDQTERYIYALEYDNDKRNTFIRLVRFGMDAPEKVVFADSIPYKFHDVGSFCNLFLNKKSNEFIAITSFLEGGETTVGIYSLPFPPLNASDLIQEKETKFSWLLWGGITGLIILSIILIFVVRYRSKNKSHTTEEFDYDANEQPSRIQSPAIYLLGGFQIIDKEENDITGKFTSVLKNLFLCILLKTLQDEKGVTSRSIEETLWRFMDQNSAINNRNVNMRKLRLLLQSLGDVSIINENNYWRLEGNSVYCDYKRILQLLKELKTGRYNNINEALDLILSGSLLPATQDAWVDVYKSEYSNQVTEVLTELSSKPEIKSDLKILLKTANAMLVLDNIDENAIALKCYALYNLGKKGLALKAFENFCAEYKKILNTNPNINFQTIITKQ